MNHAHQKSPVCAVRDAYSNFKYPHYQGQLPERRTNGRNFSKDPAWCNAGKTGVLDNHQKDSFPRTASRSMAPNQDLTEPNQAKLFQGSCFWCLAQGLMRKSCTSQVRCRSCYNYGHLSRFCHAIRRRKSYRPKSVASSGSPSFISLQHQPFASLRHQQLIAFLAKPAALPFHGSGARRHPCIHGKQNGGS
jgi:hypothetical protein